MSQSAARKARRECKRAGSHLMVKSFPDHSQLCTHCDTVLPAPPRRGMLTPKMTRGR